MPVTPILSHWSLLSYCAIYSAIVYYFPVIPILFSMSDFYDCVWDSYFIVQVSHVLFYESPWYYSVSISYTIMWVTHILLCQWLLFYCAIYLFTDVPGHSYTIVPVTLLLFYPSFSYYSASRIYTIVPVTLIPLSTVHILL